MSGELLNSSESVGRSSGTISIMHSAPIIIDNYTPKNRFSQAANFACSTSPECTHNCYFSRYRGGVRNHNCGVVKSNKASTESLQSSGCVSGASSLQNSQLFADVGLPHGILTPMGTPSDGILIERIVKSGLKQLKKSNEPELKMIARSGEIEEQSQSTKNSKLDDEYSYDSVDGRVETSVGSFKDSGMFAADEMPLYLHRSIKSEGVAENGDHQEEVFDVAFMCNDCLSRKALTRSASPCTHIDMSHAVLWVRKYYPNFDSSMETLLFGMYEGVDEGVKTQKVTLVGDRDFRKRYRMVWNYNSRGKTIFAIKYNENLYFDGVAISELLKLHPLTLTYMKIIQPKFFFMIGLEESDETIECINLDCIKILIELMPDRAFSNEVRKELRIFVNCSR